MSENTKKAIWSGLETFGAAFIVTTITLIEPVINAGQFPTKELIISAGVAGAIAGGKALLKFAREYFTGVKAGEDKKEI